MTIGYDRLSACLHFVCLKGDVLDTKISSIIGPRKHTKTNNKKKRKSNKIKEDDEWLDEQIILVQLEKSELEKKKIKQCEEPMKNIFAILEKIACRKSKIDSFHALKEHDSAIVMVQIVLSQMLADWVMDARRLLGTHKESRAALDWDVDNRNGLWRSVFFKVRTTAQLKFTQIVLSLAFESKKDDFEWFFGHTSCGCIWDVRQYVRSFELKWKLHLIVDGRIALFKNPSVVPFQIGKIMIPSKMDYKKHFQIGKSQILMPVEDGTLVIFELIKILIERNFTSVEENEIRNILSTLYEKDNSERFIFMCSCSVDGIMLMAGISREYDYSVFHRYLFNRFKCVRRNQNLVRRITSFLVDPLTNFKIHPIISIAGFGGVPVWLPSTKVQTANIIHFCA